MSVYTGTINIYNSWREYLAANAVLGTDVFKLLLTTSSYTPNLNTHTVLADITNEVSGNGYARATLGSISWTHSGAVATFTSGSAVFTASGGSIVARNYVIYDDSVASPVKPLVCYGLLDNSIADITVTDGNTLTWTPNASGIFTLS